MTFEEWKVKHDDEIVNVATVFFNYERGVDTRTCYDELEWLLRKAFISGQNHCNCVHTDNSKVIEKLEGELNNTKYKLTKTKDLLWQLIDNAPNTYSGTDIGLQQKKMFTFQKAVNDTVELLEEIDR